VLTAFLGAGGMGEVWKARDTRLDRPVAIKRLTGPPGIRFQREARAIAALNHPHICQIHDVGPDYLVLEFIEGAPLEGPMPLDLAIKIALQIASALEEAHRKGILHRDLKPSNVLVAPTGIAKLLDFGLARLESNTDALDTVATTPGVEERAATGTLAGSIVGTPPYMSPEQAQEQPLDQRSDVFAFGAVLYEMLAGNVPSRDFTWTTFCRRS
jgi:serine/threonine protein kinase